MTGGIPALWIRPEVVKRLIDARMGRSLAYRVQGRESDYSEKGPACSAVFDLTEQLICRTFRSPDMAQENRNMAIRTIINRFHHTNYIDALAYNQAGFRPGDRVPGRQDRVDFIPIAPYGPLSKPFSAPVIQMSRPWAMSPGSRFLSHSPTHFSGLLRVSARQFQAFAP